MDDGGLEVFWRDTRPDSVHPAERNLRMEKPNRGVALKEREVQLTQEQFPLLQSYGRAVPKPIAFFLKQLYSVVSYRRPMTVSEYVAYRDAFGRESVYYICPHCDVTLEREYQAYCDRCGQRLGWKFINRTKQRIRNT